MRIRHGWWWAVLLGAHLAAVAAEDNKSPLSSTIEFLLGEDQWQPGDRYRAGNDWLALVCGKADCRFEPAKLAVRREKWQGHYDDTPTSGQKLTLRRQAPGAGTVVAWFKLNPAVSWLAAGPVTTYAANTFKKKRPATEGTLELAVDLPGGEQATLVPLLDRQGSKFILQLRVPGKRQLLDELGGCSRVVTSEYLVWAGDIDHDGKPDYLIDFADDVGEAKLYQGQEAGPGEIAGVAAVYVPPPFGGECDGQGWLE